jgi:hypothetical protein
MVERHVVGGVQYVVSGPRFGLVVNPIFQLLRRLKIDMVGNWLVERKQYRSLNFDGRRGRTHGAAE